MVDKTKKLDEAVKPSQAYLKEQILSAKKYRNRVDIIGALLEDGKEYTHEQVDALIEKYMKGKVI